VGGWVGWVGVETAGHGWGGGEEADIWVSGKVRWGQQSLREKAAGEEGLQHEGPGTRQGAIHNARE
jgi:hypothetical protein